jgi:putative ABC transport system permease protein
MCFAIKAATDPASLVKAVQREIWTVDKDQAVSFTMSMPELVSESVAPQRVVAVLLGLFAGLALLMAVVGIYAVVSFSVAQRTHEIGVRMALGARSGDVLGLVVRQGLAPVAAGLAVGIACSFALLRFLSSVIYGVRPSDPLILAVVSLILTAAAMLASYAPARRASRVDPMVALHYD